MSSPDVAQVPGLPYRHGMLADADADADGDRAWLRGLAPAPGR